MKRIAAIGAIAFSISAALAPVAVADTPADIGQAIHCGFLEGAGSSFLDPNCDGRQYQSKTWEAGPYGSRQSCEQAGRLAVADGRAKSYRCYLGHTTYRLHATR
ncbi:hypothetical protein SEA_BBQVALINDRA_36 [Gordonia phage BBQValindra]|nr:hypothetical protein SEA_BBQVALINDRA_36 [Gordonia phage BBQValindra]